MNNLKGIVINERSTIYDVVTDYHSDLKDKDYSVAIVGVEENDGLITIKPDSPFNEVFTFKKSDPDRVIAIAQMIISFAQMVKGEIQSES